MELSRLHQSGHTSVLGIAQLVTSFKLRALLHVMQAGKQQMEMQLKDATAARAAAEHRVTNLQHELQDLRSSQQSRASHQQ